MGTIGNRPAGSAIIECDFGHRYWAKDAVVADGWYGPECPHCCDAQMYSDLYKDEHGFRPRLDLDPRDVQRTLARMGVDPAGASVEYLPPARELGWKGVRIDGR